MNSTTKLPKSMPKSLTNTQAMRYNRHIVLPQVDLDGQEALLNAHAVVIGVGGLGTAAATSLCASGVGKITLIDFDIVEQTNLPRQTLYKEDDVNKRKVDAGATHLKALNSHCEINVVTVPFDNSHQDIIADANVVLDCTDNVECRDVINTLCFNTQTPLVSGAAIRFEGQLFVAIPGKSRCYGCLRKLFNEPNLSCVEAGIFSPVVNIIGTYQAMLAMQVLMGFDNLPLNQLITFDGLRHEWQHWTLPDGLTCSLCSSD
ncbi:molybdopterin-synthase adenylyltransferase MoeB [Alteromonas sp. KUL42]|nr:HesA/MoeB/ThiF family protein [Alteromonas sp. KUL42]GEA06462.1 molybdopterin-synthase adenylyltransferase MoeB [Alteromonas sp. KUL42]